jgi:uridine kinase
MPASDPRRDLVSELAQAINAIPAAGIVRVGVDGVDGAGKTTLADELAAAVRGLGRSVIRAGVDSFHNPRAIRYRRGRTSPDGFFLDSYDYTLLRRVLLDPLSRGGSGRYRAAAFDHVQDRPMLTPERAAARRAVLIFDGIFLHRPELFDYWDYSIFLRVGFDTSIPRCAQARPGLSSDPRAESNRRYVEGQRIYLRTCEPERPATIVIDNEDLDAPSVVDRTDQPRSI